MDDDEWDDLMSDDAALTRYEKFREFHLDNPAIFTLFAQYASAALARGRKVGARLIGERIRWYTMIDTHSDDDYKVNNNHWPYYARLLMLTDPGFEEFFECRGGGGDATDEQLLSDCG